MKICVITTSYPAYKGHFQSPFVYELTKNLVKNKQNVEVVCPFYKISKSKQETIEGIKIHRFQYAYPRFFQKLTSGGGIPSNMKSSFLAKIQLPFFLLSMMIKSFKVAKKCDIVHAQWALSGLIGVFIKKIYKKPLILTTRGAAVDLALKKNFSKKILVYILKNCDYITPNNFKHIDIISKLGVKTKLKAIPNGVNVDLFKPINKEGCRKTLNLPKNKKIILSIGWLIPRKGFNYFLDAIPPLVEKDKDLLFIILGDGILEKDLKKKVKDRGIEQYVKFVKSQSPEKIPLWVNASDTLVLASLSEGRPNVVVESMACNTPVIATDVGGTKDLVKNKETGLLIKSKSSKEIKEAISLILYNFNLRKKLEKNSRKFVIDSKLTWKDSANNYISIYKGVLNK